MSCVVGIGGAAKRSRPSRPRRACAFSGAVRAWKGVPTLTRGQFTVPARPRVSSSIARMRGAIRRDRDRRRPQRPGHGRLPRPRRPAHGRPRAPRRPRRRRGHRGDRARLPVQRRLLRRLAASARDRARARAAPPRPRRSCRSTARSRRSTTTTCGARTTTAAPLRELRRWSLCGRRGVRGVRRSLMAQMARFIKPILSAVPARPGPHPTRAEWLLAGARWRAASPRCRGGCSDTFIQLMTMSAADFLDQWFETDPLKATMSASGIIGTFQGVRSPGTAYVLLHHYMGEIDGAFRAWGIPRGGTGGVSLAIASAARALGAEIRTEAAVAPASTCAAAARSGVTLAVRRGARGRRRPLERRPAGHVPRPARAGRARRPVRRRRAPVPVPRLVGQGQPRARRAARLHLPARPGRAPARRDQLLAVGRLHGAGLRRRQVRPVLAPALHRHRSSRRSSTRRWRRPAST